ncbi:MAG: sulfotransferase, partial [Pseudomonadota bacterium]
MTSLTTKPHDRPVFILATPRSGTTIIQRCLNLSPELMIWGEHGGFLKQVRLAYRRVTQYRMLERFGVHDADTKRRVMAGEPVLFDGRWSTEWMSPFSSEIAYYAHRDFLLQLFARDVPPEIRWGFKEVQYGYRDVRFLSEMFPGAQFVFPLRGPFETMLSKVRAFDSGQLEGAPLDLYIKQYNDALEMVDASHLRADLSALVVPLDGFQSDPVEGTARIARFLGVPPIDKDAILALKAARVGWEGGDQLAEDLRKAVGDDPRFQETAAKYESHVQNANAMANVSAPAAPTPAFLEDHAEPPRWP